MQQNNQTIPQGKSPPLPPGVILFDKNGDPRYVSDPAWHFLGIPQSGDPAGLMAALPDSTRSALLDLLQKVNKMGDAVRGNLPIQATEDHQATACGALAICLEGGRQVILEMESPDHSRDAGLLMRQNEELMMIAHTLKTATDEMDAELEMARQIQESILPESLPVIPEYSFAAEYIPTGKVGGDFYNLRMLDAENLLVLQADVSGHGVPAAFVTAIAKTFFDRSIKAGADLAESLKTVNDEFCENIKTEHYLTAFVAILHLPSGALQYSRICHPYPILFRAASEAPLEYLRENGGFFLGMMKDQNEFQSFQTILQPGDRLLIYTDGLNEGFNASNDQYGRERLGESVLRHARHSPKSFLENIMQDRKDFVKSLIENDDITALAIGRDKAHGS